MSSFTTPLKLEYLNGRTWKVLEEFEYWVGEEVTSEVIVVPAGFITDFASIPRVFWRILPPTDTYGKAAVIHDRLYDLGIKTREECDKIFLDAMEVLGVPAWKRYTMYWALRGFGWAAWNEHRRKDND